ncbi:MAG: tRNA (adenosine(37)-N6)-threonylcarbamoyltransferase complex transferase subunit TsaD [Anaerolineae bacterium]
MTLILGIETSCDETGAAVIENGRHIRSNVVATQIDLHRQYGGVFPEIASRQHMIAITPVIGQALEEAGVGYDDLDAIAVTYGPGLAGSLLVGVNTAKAIAFARGLPLVGVNHLEGHIYANWLIPPDWPRPEAPPPEPAFPLLALIVSGGHTELVLMHGHGQYQLLGRTLDDAAGEAFDKVARLLGLGFPGGPAIERAARRGDPESFRLPRAWLGDSYDFSFSGLKTAVLRIVRSFEEKAQAGGHAPRTRLVTSQSQPVVPHVPVNNLAASFQEAVVDVLVEKTRRAAEEFGVKLVLMGGGVAANSRLREEMTRRLSVPVRVPPVKLCTDNGAVIGSIGYYRFIAGERAGWDLDVVANLTLPLMHP